MPEQQEQDDLLADIEALFASVRSTINALEAGGMSMFIDGFDPDMFKGQIDSLEAKISERTGLDLDVKRALSDWVAEFQSGAKVYKIRFDNKHKYKVPLADQGDHAIKETWSEQPHGVTKPFKDYSCDCMSYISGNHKSRGRYCKHIYGHLAGMGISQLFKVERTGTLPEDWGKAPESSQPIDR
jgi:hypothetical protein